jgi:Zn-dependent protease with chaperone function
MFLSHFQYAAERASGKFRAECCHGFRLARDILLFSNSRVSDEKFLRTTCEHCSQSIEFPADALGLPADCPNCQKQILLLEDLNGGNAASGSLGAAELKAAFTRGVPQKRVSILYQMALFAVAIFMVLLPVIYIGFIGLVGYGVYWYAFWAKGLLADFVGGVHIFLLKALLYFGPLVGGSIAIFFMFKPLFAGRPPRAHPLHLNPAINPRLYQFVAHLSETLDAPMPSSIYLDCELNASAGLRSFVSRNVTLTIGLPLVAGMNTRQLAAVIAHEFGHFTQGGAMRCSYIINRIDGWFARVVYARDTWDEWLEEWSNSTEDSRLWLITACAHVAVWLSRQVLKLLMLVGHAFSCLLSRQMEFHADACAIRVVGAEGFENMLLRLQEQAVLASLAYEGMERFWKTRRCLPESIPNFLQNLEAQMPPNFHEQARNTLLNQKSSLWATHPTSARRIQKARQSEEPGIFHLELPAANLFGDFNGTSKMITLMHFQENLQLPVTSQTLKPANDFFAQKVA